MIAGAFDTIVPVVHKVKECEIGEKISVFIVCLNLMTDAKDTVLGNECQQHNGCAKMSFRLFFDASLSNNLFHIKDIGHNLTTSSVVFKESRFLTSRLFGCERKCTSLLHTFDCRFKEIQLLRGVIDVLTSKMAFSDFFKLISAQLSNILL